ncbi:MAG: hypothetical protein WAP52_03605 [Candidatus Sungiibacteriota bacterium]
MATQLRGLPYRVLDDSRTAGFIDAEGIAALLDEGFTQEAIYPVAKAYDHAPRAQEYFFRQLVPILKACDPYALADFLRAEIAKIGAADSEVRKRNLARAIRGSLTREPLSVRVRVAQLVQWNRLDRAAWRQCMKDAVWACQRRNIEPVLVAYAVLVALPDIIQRIGGCYILNLGWINDARNPYCGLCLSDDSPAFLVEKGECLPVNPYIMDDTIRTGITLNDLRRYLANCGNRIVTPRILWDARDAQARAAFPVDGSTVLEWTEEG